MYVQPPRLPRARAASATAPAEGQTLATGASSLLLCRPRLKLIGTAGRPLQYLSYCTYNETLISVIARRLNLFKDTFSEY